MSALLNKYSTPAERLRGCVWADLFQSATEIERNGGTITGSPGYATKRGIALDGTNDYVTYSIDPVTLAGSTLSFVIEFSSSFASTDNIAVHFFNSNNEFSIFKKANAGSNDMRLMLGGTTIADIAHATWSASYKRGARNVLVISGTSGATSAWLNGTKILDADPTAWGGLKETSLTVGAQHGGGNKFPGTMHSLKIFNSALNELEAIDYYDGTTLDYRYRSLCHLPMRTAEHDAAGKRTLDIGPGAHHATLGDGSTAATYPTRMSKRGYTFDGGDYLDLGAGNILGGPFTICFLVYTNNRDATKALFSKESASNGFRLWQTSGGSGSWAFSVYDSGGTIRTASGGRQTVPGKIVSVVGVRATAAHYIYIDGSLDSQYLGATATVTNTEKMIIGAKSDLSIKFDGGVFNVELFNSALTDTQIADWHIRAMREINQV